MKIRHVFLLWVVAFTTLVALKGCDQAPEFTPDYEKLSYPTQVTVLPDKIALQAEYERVSALADPDSSVKDVSKVGTFDRQGFSYYQGGVCNVVVIEPPRDMSANEYAELIGHEHLHCMFGRWHGDSSKHPKIVFDTGK